MCSTECIAVTADTATDMGTDTDTGMATDTENTDTALRNTVTGKAVILRAETTRIRTKNDR